MRGHDKPMVGATTPALAKNARTGHPQKISPFKNDTLQELSVRTLSALCEGEDEADFSQMWDGEEASREALYDG